MHIISKKALVNFWLAHRDAEKPLRSWYQLCKQAKFESFAQIKRAFNAIDKVGKFTVFDIGGNKWRLIAIVNYSGGKIYVRQVMTHEQYDEDYWKRK
jgi:mRNA interferase HigB